MKCSYIASSIVPFLQHLNRHLQAKNQAEKNKAVDVRSKIHQEWCDQFFPLPDLGDSVLGARDMKSIFNGTFNERAQATAEEMENAEEINYGEEYIFEEEDAEKENVEEYAEEESFNEEENLDQEFGLGIEGGFLGAEGADELENFIVQSGFDLDSFLDEADIFLNAGSGLVSGSKGLGN